MVTWLRAELRVHEALRVLEGETEGATCVDDGGDPEENTRKVVLTALNSIEREPVEPGYVRVYLQRRVVFFTRD